MSDIETIDKEREDRDITKKDMSILVGYQNGNGWYQMVEMGHKPEEKLERAKWVFEYYDEHGYIPDPREVP